MFFVWSSGGRGGGGMMAGGARPRLHLHLIGLCLYLLQMIDLDSLLSSSSSSNNNRRSPPAAILRELELPTLAMFAPLVVVPMALLCARLWTSGGPAVAVHREGFRRRLDDLERSVADVGWMTLSAGAALLSLAVGAVLGFTVRLWSVSSVLSVVMNVVGIYVATMSLVDFWRDGPTPGGAGGAGVPPPPRRERPGGLGGFWRGDHPWWRYPGGDGGGGRTSGGGETESPLSHIVGIVQGMPIEEYVPDDELPDCTVKQLRRMIELRRARHGTGDDGASTAVEKVELVEAARRCRNYDDDGGDPCCIICQEDYERGDPLRILPRCGHEFHVECIDRWAYAFASKRDSTPGGAWGSRSSSRPREPSCPLCKTALKE